MKLQKKICLIIVVLHAAINGANIGLLIVATGKYINFVPRLIQSARTHFCAKHNVSYFVFTDGKLQDTHNVVTIFQKKLGWPYDTLMRFPMYYEHKELLKNMDYVFACDADMLFVDTVGDEILGNLVGTLHPGYVGSQGTYETNPISRAYIAPFKGKYYFAGGFNGGKTEEYLAMAQTITENIYHDLKKKFIAIWHDESHLNKYFVEHEPKIILSPSYCYPEGWKLNYHQRLIALSKNHEAMRN